MRAGVSEATGTRDPAALSAAVSAVIGGGGDPPSGASEVGPCPAGYIWRRRAPPALSRTRRPGSDRRVAGLIISGRWGQLPEEISE